MISCMASMHENKKTKKLKNSSCFSSREYYRDFTTSVMSVSHRPDIKSHQEGNTVILLLLRQYSNKMGPSAHEKWVGRVR